MNGTGAKNLVESLVTAAGALLDAMDALNETRPNARDYYPQGDDAFPQAVREYQARARMLREVSDELYVIAEAVQDQADARLRRNPRRRP
jgi:hypothetical protein